MSPTPRRRRTLLALAASVVALPLVAANAATPPPYPGLPAGEGYQWAGVAQRGVGESARARQSFWIPANVATADVVVSAIRNPEPGVSVRTISTNNAFFVSPPGSDDNYGDLEPIVVRSLAFGMIPVEVTVHVSQQRGADGTPVPIPLSTTEDALLVDGAYTVRSPGSSIETAVDVRLSDLEVDGVPVDLGPDCRTAVPADLTLRSGGYELTPQEKVSLMSTREGLETLYLAGIGGRLTGNLTVPAFVGCTADGEDLSPLLTTAVSGPDNDVVLQLTGPGCSQGQLGVPPGQGTDLSVCNRADDFSRAAFAAIDALELPTRD